MTYFIEEMDKLAATIAQKAVGTTSEPTSLADQIDAFKALTPYYVQKMKAKENSDDESGENTFGSFQDRIHATEHTNGAAEPGISGSRKRRSTAESGPGSSA